MRVKFWGTRGSIPSPGPETVIYGGNTPCVEMCVGRAAGGAGRLIFDAGSGIRKLGLALLLEPTPLDAALLFSHVHWDHIQGFPFFAPAYREGNRLEIFGLEVAHRQIQRLLSDQMEQAYFPVDLRSMKAEMRFRDLGQEGEGLECRGARIKLLRGNHTSETCGFRVEDPAGVSVVYLTDNELGRCGEDGCQRYEDFVRFCGDADLVIHDSQYERANLARYRGWGHSAFEDSLKLALDAGARRLALFHPDPQTADGDIERRLAWCREEVAARGARLEVDAAREEAEIEIGVSGAGLQDRDRDRDRVRTGP